MTKQNVKAYEVDKKFNDVPKLCGVCPHGVMVKAMDCRIVVTGFILQSCNYILFWANTLWKVILPAMG